MSFLAKKAANFPNTKWKQMCIDKIELGDLKCDDLVVERTQKDVAKEFTAPNEPIIKECVRKIIKAICSAIQSDKIKSITNDIKDKIIRFLTDLSPRAKEIIANSLLSEIDVVEKQPEKNNVGEITYTDNEPQMEKLNPIATDNYANLKNGDTMLKYSTDILCDAIKMNSGLLDVFIGSVYRRFEKYIRDNNNKQEIVIEILEPIAKETRRILKSKINDMDALREALKITPLEVLGIKPTEYSGLMEKDDAALSTILAAKSTVLKEKLQGEIENINKLASITNIRRVLTEESKKTPNQSGGSKSRKVNLYKKLLKRERTLKRRIFSH
jgi:hypothetical protein